MRKYIVKSGDTLMRIAKLFYNNEGEYDKIVQANHLASGATLQVGQRLQIPGTDIDGDTFQLPINKYFSEPQPKRMIVIHFTAGTTAAGAFSTFKNSTSRMGVPFIIDRDGKTYELFAPEYWAIHLFRHKSGEYPLYYRLERNTVPIEIVNVGPLKPDRTHPRQLNWWIPADALTGQATYRTAWCTLDEKEKYVKKTDREIDYFATFTEPQYVALKKLIDHLCLRFNILTQAPADKLKTDLEKMANFNGIVCHQNFRNDKYDIGPAFQWEKLGL